MEFLKIFEEEHLIHGESVEFDTLYQNIIHIHKIIANTYYPSKNIVKMYFNRYLFINDDVLYVRGFNLI